MATSVTQVSVLYLITLTLININWVTMATTDQWNVTCPSSCRCALLRVPLAPERKATQTVDCSHRKLYHLPQDIPTDVQALLLRDNVINKPPPTSFDDLITLEILDLSYNDLEQLTPPTIFGNISSLEILNLEGNHLSTIQHGVFSGMPDLDELNLSANRLTSIEEHAFGGLNKLRTLVLSRNHLTKIKPEWLANLSQLQSLSLDHNQLNGIEGGSFLGMTHLTKLSLSHNNISALSADSFMSLSELNQLDLSHNQLTKVSRDALSVFKRLKLLTMDDNPIVILLPGSFQALTIGELSLCNMSQLSSLDRHSIVNMPQLHTLRIHGNPRLVYIDPETLEDVPLLDNIMLHDNHLSSLSYNVITSLPSLRQVTLYNNPLQCDCNAFWVRTALMNVTSYEYNDTIVSVARTLRHITFPRPEDYICDTPSGSDIRHLVDIQITSMTKNCEPTVIALFNESYQVEVGKSVKFECRAIGVPPPRIHWILSNGKIMRSTTNVSRVRVSRTGTISIENLKADHAGTYTCVANSSQGYDTTSTVLRIHSNNIHILSRGSTNSYITVTWNGTESTIDTSDYVIMYKEQANGQPYRPLVHIKPYIRTYTLNNLKPDTFYEFCITYQYAHEMVKLNCLAIKTKDALYMMRGVRTISKLTILLALCLTSLGVILICVLMVIVRRYQRRKSYQEPGGGTPVTGPQPLGNGHQTSVTRYQHRHNNDSHKVSQISNIPLDNLYNPPTTPLCTSTTSLISTSTQFNA